MKPTATQSDSTFEPRPDRVRIVSTPGMCGGRPRIDGHRITVADIAIWHERMGMAPDEIVFAHPTLTLSDVHAALAYYFENRETIDNSIREDEQFAAEMRAKAGPSLIQQKLRQKTADASDDSVSS
jgi:uncharacterized protein (DUF433 family)